MVKDVKINLHIKREGDILEKQAIRNLMLKQRDELPLEFRAHASQLICQTLEKQLKDERVWRLYAPFASEVDI